MPVPTGADPGNVFQGLGAVGVGVTQVACLNDVMAHKKPYFVKRETYFARQNPYGSSALDRSVKTYDTFAEKITQ